MTSAVSSLSSLSNAEKHRIVQIAGTLSEAECIQMFGELQALQTEDDKRREQELQAFHALETTVCDAERALKHAEKTEHSSQEALENERGLEQATEQLEDS